MDEMEDCVAGEEWGILLLPRPGDEASDWVDEGCMC